MPKMERNNNQDCVIIESVYFIYYDIENKKARNVWIDYNTWTKIHRLLNGEDDCCNINGTLLIKVEEKIVAKGQIKNLEEFSSFTKKIICSHHKPVSSNVPFRIKDTSCNCWEILTGATLDNEKENTLLKDGTLAMIN